MRTRARHARRSASRGRTCCASRSHTARKNLAALVPAARALARDGIEVVVAGGHRPQFAAEQGLDGLRLLGHVPEALLPGLYAGAEAFALPSHYEGFGLPVLEAMAAGTPVVAADTSALPETCGGAARLAPPDGEAFREALQSLLADRGRARAPARRRARAGGGVHVGGDGAGGRRGAAAALTAAVAQAQRRASVDFVQPWSLRAQLRNVASAGASTAVPARNRRRPAQSNALGPTSGESHVYQYTRSIRFCLRAADSSSNALLSRRGWSASVTVKPAGLATLSRAAGHDSSVIQIGSLRSP